MKKFLLIVLFCSMNFVYVDETDNSVYLDLDTWDKHKYNLSTPKIENMSVKDKDDDLNEDYIYHPMKYIKSEISELYSDRKFSQKKEKNFGKTTFGAKYDTTLKTNDYSQKRTLYTNHKLTKKMSIRADYQTNTLKDADSQLKGTIGVGPEYQLNNKIKLKNKYSKNFENNSNKGELSVEYKPFKDDRMDFNAGAAQIQQDDGNSSRSQVNFGTNIRF